MISGLRQNQTLKLAVVGDINDGFGLDYYEQRFSRSAVETLLGNVWAPDRILRHILPRPKLRKYGWEPSSSSFRDVVTRNRVNVLIDHILVSQSVKFSDAIVWNPFLDDAPKIVKRLKPALTRRVGPLPNLRRGENLKAVAQEEGRGKGNNLGIPR